MVIYPYDKHDVLLKETYIEVNNTLQQLNKQKNPNTKRKITEKDIEIIVDEYFKDLAIWLQDPHTNIYDIGDLGYIKVAHLAINNFLQRTLLPKARTLDDNTLTKKRISILWKLKQLKDLDYVKRKRIETILYNTQNNIKLYTIQPDYRYGDLFDIKTPTTKSRLIANLDRKDFLEILNSK